MTINRLLNDRVLVAPIKPPVTLGGIHLPESLRDDYNTGGVKLFRVIMTGPGWTHRKSGRTIPMECKPGDRVFCHSYTEGPVELGEGQDGRKIVTYSQILAVLPS